MYFKWVCPLIWPEIKFDDVIVDFPKHKGWKGILSEMELINDSGQLPLRFFFFLN